MLCRWYDLVGLRDLSYLIAVRTAIHATTSGNRSVLGGTGVFDVEPQEGAIQPLRQQAPRIPCEEVGDADLGSEVGGDATHGRQ